MARVKGDKYNKKYAKALMNGARIDGLSIPELCQQWHITRTTYNYWVANVEEFKAAHEYGVRDCSAWWQKLNRDVACGKTRGNAGVLNFAMKNVDGVGWQETVAASLHTDKEVHTININVLQPRQLMLPEETIQDVKVIEYDPDYVD